MSEEMDVVEVSPLTKISSAVAMADYAAVARTRAIRETDRAGYKPMEIALVAGISLGRVYQILRGDDGHKEVRT